MEQELPLNHLPIVIIVSVLLFAGVIWSYQSARNRPGSIVIPGGITYLGPTPVTAETAVSPSVSPLTARIPVPSGASWSRFQGKTYPYAFAYPSTLSLGVFPNDPYDSVTVFYDNTDANTNIFFRVDNLTKLNKTAYIGKPRDYATDWWKDYAWNGVKSVTDFTNAKGLKGYRATYINGANETPYDHVFFEVPGKSDLVIWASGKLFQPAIFDRIIDSITWQ